ncbi:replicative DNA helicase, partial [Patescibacteria group bacterium]|nr:replicative DNA helicase [Patescibacteria group bacterium]
MSSFEKVTPQNIEAEQSYLGSLLLDKDAMIKVADAVQADDFYLDKHRRVYEAMLALYRKSEPIDLLSLSNRLNERGDLERIGGRAELIALSNAVPTA